MRALPRSLLKSEPGSRELSLLAAFAEDRGSSSEEVVSHRWFWSVGFSGLATVATQKNSVLQLKLAESSL